MNTVGISTRVMRATPDRRHEAGECKAAPIVEDSCPPVRSALRVRRVAATTKPIGTIPLDTPATLAAGTKPVRPFSRATQAKPGRGHRTAGDKAARYACDTKRQA